MLLPHLFWFSFISFSLISAWPSAFAAFLLDTYSHHCKPILVSERFIDSVCGKNCSLLKGVCVVIGSDNSSNLAGLGGKKENNLYYSVINHCVNYKTKDDVLDHGEVFLVEAWVEESMLVKFQLYNYGKEIFHLNHSVYLFIWSEVKCSQGCDRQGSNSTVSHR